MALIAILIAASLSADPARLVLGKDPGAAIEVHASSSAKVTLSTSVGSIGAVTHDGGTFRAHFTPPAHRAPSVALVLAQIDDGNERELSWLSIPLTGSDTMEIETRPGSKVEADVPGQPPIGPIMADKNGIVRLPMVVPPGVDKGTLHITDKLGNVTHKPLDLEPPPFSRVRMAVRGAQSASPNAPIYVEVFVVKPDGTPDDDARVTATADDGEVQLRRRIGPGVYLGEYVPGQAGTARLEAKVGGQTAAMDVPVKASRAVIASRVAGGPSGPWSISAGVLGGLGATYDGAIAGSILLEGAVRLESLPIEALLDLGLGFYGESTQPGATPTTLDKASPKTKLVQIGVRVSHQLFGIFDGHASATVGLQDQSVSKTLASGTQVSRDEWTPRFAFAVGGNVRAGPGRILAQVQLDASGSDVAGLSSSLGSAQVMVGYLVTLR